MNKLIALFFLLILLNHCSFNKNSKIWKKNEKDISIKPNIEKIFSNEKFVIKEFNQSLKLDLSAIKIKNINFDNQNNFGSQSFDGSLNKNGSYKFSKLEEINRINFKPIFLKNGVIYFDKKGTIIRYDNNQKIVWKKNYYTKLERELYPKLNLILDKDNILITDSIAKYYSIKLNNGELNWSKNNSYPFNSDIKKSKNSFYVVDYKNTLRCYYIYDGSECWSLQTDESFTISNSKNSLIVLKDKIVFSNSIGDITAVDSESGQIIWQLPTQSSSIINKSYSFKNSKLVSDSKIIFLSNNKNEFYSIDSKTGTINWINKVNSNLTPILISNLIFTVSNEGFLYVIEKNKGNILRITDLYVNYDKKKRKNIYPLGFVIGNKSLYLTNSDGKIIVAGLQQGNITKTQKVSKNFTSKPFIFNRNLFLVRNGSIDRYN